MSKIPLWQRKIVKDKMREYRQALQNYYISEKRVIDLPNGQKAFSLLSPPIGAPAARRRIKFIMENLTASDQDRPLQKRTPHFVTLAVHYDCQCACRHCSAAHYQTDAAATLTTAELHDAVRQCIELGSTSVVFTGGEPLLHRSIYELISRVDRTKAISTIFTNGEYLDTQAAIKLKKAGLFGAFVSFDYADAAGHDDNRQRPGIFQKAKAALLLCQKQGILTGISTYVTKEKLASGELDRIMELARDLNVLEVFIFDVIPVGKLQGQHQCALVEGDFNAIKTLRAKYNQKPEFPRIIHQTMLTSIAYPCTGEGCPAGIAHMHIRAHGDVSPCDFTPFSFGNVRSGSLKSIWKNITESRWYASPSPVCRLSSPEFLTALENQKTLVV